MSSNSIHERKSVTAGKEIIAQGEKGNSAFLIQSGKVRITAKSNNKEVELSVLGPGQIFGEMALVFDDPRSATATAVEDCNLIVITRKVFQEKLNKSDPTVKAIVPMLMKRIINTNQALTNQKATVEELADTVKAMYQGIHDDLPPAQQRSLHNAVLPHLDEFLSAVKAFGKRYKDE